MAIIIPNEIQDVGEDQPKRKIEVIFDYIKYMKESLEFWGNGRQKDIENLNLSVTDLDGRETTTAQALESLTETVESRKVNSKLMEDAVVEKNGRIYTDMLVEDGYIVLGAMTTVVSNCSLTPAVFPYAPVDGEWHGVWGLLATNPNNEPLSPTSLGDLTVFYIQQN